MTQSIEDKALKPTFDGRLQFYQFYYEVKRNALKARQLGLLGLWRDELHELADHAQPYMSSADRKKIYDGEDDLQGLWQLARAIDKIGNIPLINAPGQNLLERKQMRIKQDLYKLQAVIGESVKHMLLPIGDFDDEELDIDKFMRDSGV